MSDQSMFEVDTAEVRATARKLKAVADELQSALNEKMKQMRSTVKENLRGDAADAMSTTLEDLSKDVTTIVNGINKVQSALKSYAAEVERVDQELSNMIK